MIRWWWNKMIINSEIIDKNDVVIKMLKIKMNVKNIKIKKLNFKMSEDLWLYIISNIVNKCHENNSWISFE